MNELEYKLLAFHVAKETKPHLGQPTSPPRGWRLEGSDLVVLLADCRKVRVSLPSVSKLTDNILSLPVHKPAKKRSGRKI